MNKLFYAMLGMAALAAAPASASITFVDNPGNLCTAAGLGGGCEENIQFEAQALVPSLSITGDTNQSAQPVIFDTTFNKGTGSLGGAGTGQMIAADGLGQGNIICEPGATVCVNNAPPPGFNSQLTSLEMKPGNNTAWGDVLINLDNGVGQANIFVTDNMGHNFDDVLGNGQNFLGIIASAGEVITDIQISEVATATGQFGWNDFKQPRVSGTCTLVSPTNCVAIPIAEPNTLAILGGSLIMLGMYYRRYRRRDS